METFFRTFFIILLMEVGSASQLTLAAMTIHSKSPIAAYAGGISAFLFSCILAVMLGKFLDKLPVSMNLISGILLIASGGFLLWKS